MSRHQTATTGDPSAVRIADGVRRIAKKWSRQRGSLIMALHEVQEHYGYVPRDVALQIAQLMDVPMARIFEVITFYNFFRLEPLGRFNISVCLGTACYLQGGGALLDAFAEELGIAEGQTTADGEFHLQSVRCVGCCGLAPVVVINGTTYSKVTPQQARDLVAGCRAHGAPQEV